MTWTEIVDALEQLGRGSPKLRPGLFDRVMHRLSREGSVPTVTQSSRGAPVQRDAAAGNGTPTGTLGQIGDD